MRSRRRSRRSRGSYGNRRGPGNKAKLTFAPVIVILCLSVGCGYATAKYVVDPVVNYVPELMAEEPQQSTEESVDTEQEEENAQGSDGKSDAADDATDRAIIEDEAKVRQSGKIAGYALQFGCYSSREAAETVLPTLGIDNLQIIEQGNLYKIIGQTYQTKGEAKEALTALPETAAAFVTTIYEE